MAAMLGEGATLDGGLALQRALLDSRQRWRDLVTLAADWVFETDAEGRFTFLWPDRILGWAAADLLHEPARRVLLPREAAFDPFLPRPAFQRRRAWCRTAAGPPACLLVTALPIMESGSFEGLRGLVHDITAEDAEAATTSAALRRSGVMDHILEQMRQEVMAPRMMTAVLEELASALDAEGAAVLDMLTVADEGRVLHQAGAAPGALLPLLRDAARDHEAGPSLILDDHPVILAASCTRFGERSCLAVWRAPGQAPWSLEDTHLAVSAAALVRVVLEHAAIQRELALQARTDPLTGLLNRRSFLEEVERRIDRLDRERLPGTLMYVDLDHFKRINDSCGHDVGDQALVELAKLLRNTVRPSDLVARLGGDEFALWMDGSDELTAAERAERLRLDGPVLLADGLPPGAPPLSISIGIAARHPHVAESLDEVMRRADATMYEVKRAGRGAWRVSPNPRFA